MFELFMKYLTQIGLLLDIIGFVILFFYGGFEIGKEEYVESQVSKKSILYKKIGFVLIIFGFVLQLCATLNLN